MAHPHLLHLVTRDVAFDDDLLRRYGARVPVLAWRERELDWPFAAADVARLLNQPSPP